MEERKLKYIYLNSCLSKEEGVLKQSIFSPEVILKSGKYKMKQSEQVYALNMKLVAEIAIKGR